MEMRKLGKTGITVSRLGMGTLTMSPMQRGLSIEAGAAVILASLELGVRFVDTAQMYGSYPQVRRALDAWKGERVVVATKSPAASSEAMLKAIDEARLALGLDVIDLFLLHAVKNEDAFAARRPALDVLLQAKAKGIVKAVGASSHSLATIRFLASCPEIEVLHPMLNRDGWGILDGSVADMLQVLQGARGRGLGIYAMKPLGGGHMRGDAVAALRWAFAREEIDAAAVGMTSQAEVEMNVTVARGRPVSAELVAQARGQDRRLFVNEMLCGGCGLCVQTCDHQALSLVGGKARVDHQTCVVCGYCAPKCPQFAIRII